MSLVENILSQISAQNIGGVSKPQSFDLSDDTFEKLLQKGINSTKVDTQNSIMDNLGMPSGMIIEPYNQAADNMAQVQPIQDDNEPFVMKDVDFGNDYFSSLLHKFPNEHKSLLSFVQKHAAGAYNTFGKGLIEDLSDFALDAVGMLK